MFKKIAFSALICSLLSLPLLAQQAPMSTLPKKQSMAMNRPMADPATRARKMTDRLTKELGLDQAASQKVYTASLTRAQKIGAIQASSDDNRTKAKNLKANADDFKSQLKGILTPDQFSRMEAMKGHMRSGRGGMRSMDADTTMEQR